MSHFELRGGVYTLIQSCKDGTCLWAGQLHTQPFRMPEIQQRGRFHEGYFRHDNEAVSYLVLLNPDAKVMSPTWIFDWFGKIQTLQKYNQWSHIHVHVRLHDLCNLCAAGNAVAVLGAHRHLAFFVGKVNKIFPSSGEVQGLKTGLRLHDLASLVLDLASAKHLLQSNRQGLVLPFASLPGIFLRTARPILERLWVFFS